MEYDKAIDIGIKEGAKNYEIARKIYLCYPAYIFHKKEEVEFEILNKICKKFKVPYNSLQIVGSSKTGRSYHKENTFKHEESDLDIAIISKDLFDKFQKEVYIITNKYSNLSSFPRIRGESVYSNFLAYLAKGMFRPDFMPTCSKKQDWDTFFNKLSNKYYDLFKNINAMIYSDIYYFESKQARNMQFYREGTY
ncbi:hypothetical protein ACFL57_01235 [Candidatus Margulisiibacteriota bacterium]